MKASSPTPERSTMHLESEGKSHRPSAPRGLFAKTFLREHTNVAILTLMSMYLRVTSVDAPGGIVTEEIETCTQINWYLQGKFFVGAAPPLSGMIYAYLAHRLGYQGEQAVYYPGQTFDAFPLYQLRLISSVMGSLLAPTAYLIVRTLGHGRLAASLAASLLILETGLVTQPRYISPEGPLCLFSGLTILAWAVQLRKQEREPFAIPWTALATTGVGIGTCISTKWQGVFTFAIVWASSLMYMWRIVGEKRFSLWYVGRQFTARFLTTAVLPVVMYLAIFNLHMNLIPKAGDHDLVVSSHLRYSLEGNEFDVSQKDVAYGSSVVLRHLGSNGGYLHSHFRRYKSGSTQQEVTVYPHFDLNSVWVIHRAGVRWNSTHDLEPVRNNDHIMLEHYPTSRKLHSHDHRPPVTNKKEQSEVSAYGDPYVHDPNDFWWIQVIEDGDIHRGKDKTPIEAVNTKFRLLHARGCHLLSHKVSLPDHGDGFSPQQEVTCMAPAKKEVSAWIIESAYHEELDGDETISFTKMTNAEKIKEVHELMLAYPSSVQDRMASTQPADPLYQHHLHELQKPWMLRWFLGQGATRFWDQIAGRAIYLTINPTGRLATVLSLCGCAIFWLADTVLRKRQVNWLQVKLWANTGAAWAGYDPVATRELYHQSIGYLAMALLVHVITLRFMPTFSMRYGDMLPTTVLGASFVPIVMEAISIRWARRYRVLLFMVIFALALRNFYRLRPVTYGNRALTVEACRHMPPQIPIDCQRFLKSNTGETATVQIQMPGKVEPFKYTVGSEADADATVASMQRASYSDALRDHGGAERYHLILSTPGPTPEDVKTWQKGIQEAADERVRLAAEEKKKKQEEEEKKKAEEAVDHDDKEGNDGGDGGDKKQHHHQEEHDEM